MCGIVCIIQDITSSLLTSNHHFEDITPTILDIMSTVSVSSQQLHQWYHSHYMYDITSSICETFCPLCLWHCIHYVWHHNPVCWLHHTRHMYDIICGTEDVTSPLSHQTKIFNDFTSTSGMKSHTLYQTSHQLYLCHHNLSTDITPTLYDITPTISVTTYALYITSYPLLMSSHYSTYDSTTLTCETTSSMQFKIYNIPVTSESLVCDITPTVLRASHPLFVSHHTRHRHSILCTIEDIKSSLYEIKPPFLWHHTHYIWHCIDAISVITPTLSMI